MTHSRGERMKKQHQMKLVIYLCIYALGVGVLIMDLSLNFQTQKLLYVLIILLLMGAHFTFSYRYYLKDSQTKTIDQLGYHIKRVGMETFNHFPVLTLVYNDKFKVTWANYYAKQFLGPKIINKHLNDIDESLYERVSLKEYLCEI